MPTSEGRAVAVAPPLPQASFSAPPPLPAAPRVEVAFSPPQRFDAALSRNVDLDISMFDGSARRRRMQWLLAMIVLLGLAAAVAATVASHFRPT